MLCEYDEIKVNEYLIAVQRNSYTISENDKDYAIWISYVEKESEYLGCDYFVDWNAGVAILRIQYINQKNCKPCDCIPELLMFFAFETNALFFQEIFNYRLLC